MKSAAAFAVGLWTGALVMAAVGAFYLHLFGVPRPADSQDGRQQLDARIQKLQLEQTNTTAEIQRLRQTVAELRTVPVAAPAEAPARRALMPDWILESVRSADAQALPKLEQAAAQNDLAALDALALLADLDNAAALTRVWSAASLDATSKSRTTVLLAATVELNPHGEELLTGLARSPTENSVLIDAALTGLVAPNFSSRLARGTGVLAQPLFKPDYALRLRIIDALRAALTDEVLLAVADRAHQRIAERVAAGQP